MCKSEIVPDVKFVQTTMPFKDIVAFGTYLESIDEHYDGDFVIITQADIFIETNRKILK